MRAFVLAAFISLGIPGCGGADKEAQDLAEIEAAEASQPIASTQSPATTADHAASATNAKNLDTGPAPVLVSGDALKIGVDSNPDGSAKDSKHVYSTTDVLHASFPVAGRTIGTQVKIYWSYQNGLSHKEEIKKVEPNMAFASFEFSKKDGLTSGKYMVQIDVNDTPAGIVDIVVK